MDRPAVIVDSVIDIKPKRQGSPSIKVEEPIQNKRMKHGSSASEHDKGSYSGSAQVRNSGTCKHCGHVVEILADVAPYIAPHIGTKGTVLLYKETAYTISPSETLVGVPATKIQVTVTSTLGPVVETIAHYYSTIQSPTFTIYIYDETDKIWEAKGYYKQVVKDNDEVQFTPHDKYGHFLRILIVLGIPKDVAINPT